LDGLIAAGAYYASSKSRVTLKNLDRKRTIFITGAASGIGLATAKLFLHQGWFVGCFDTNVGKLESLFSDLESDCCLGEIDVTVGSSCQHAIEKFMQATKGHFDVLFNCAGILRIGQLCDFALEEQIAQIKVNCVGVTNVTYMALPYLESSKGRIVSMSSLSAVAGVANHAVYSATKAFVSSFTEAIRSEGRVLCCDVAAPYVDTPMTDSQKISLPGSAFNKKSAFIGPEDVANKVWEAVYHCSFYNEHFYCGRVEIVFRLVALSRSLGLNLHTNMIHKGSGMSSRI